MWWSIILAAVVVVAFESGAVAVPVVSVVEGTSKVEQPRCNPLSGGHNEE